MAETRIYGAFRERIIDVPCSYPAYGSADVLVMYSPEGVIPTQVQILSNVGGTVYAYVDIVCLSSSGGILLTHRVIESIASTLATARSVGFVRKITLPAGTVSIGVDLRAEAATYSSAFVWRNYSPRSLTVLNAKK